MANPEGLTNLKSLTLADLERFVASLGWESYRSRQLFTWIWQKGVSEFEAITNLAKLARANLAQRACISALTETKRQVAADGTAKFAFGLEDGLVIESVFIPDPPRRTVCVSTQVGCAMGCHFCRTGQMGFKRNLKFYEIADQVVQVQESCRKDAGKMQEMPTTGKRSDPASTAILQALRSRKRSDPASPAITNVVMMGMGEPMLNLDEVLKAGEILNSDLGLKIGARHITISTAGIPEGIRRLADYPRQFKLAVSLNAADDTTRAGLMPVARRYQLRELFEAVRYYVAKTHKRVTFEYVLVRGINDRDIDADRLIRLLRNVPCKVNLIPLNACPNYHYLSPDETSVERFARLLYPHLPAVTVRESKGRDIAGACGQLST